MADKQRIFKLLNEVLCGATTCVSTTYCSVVWPGCDFPEGVCQEGFTIGVYGEIEPVVNNCSVNTYINVTIVVDLCNGAEKYTMADATERSESFYQTLDEVYSGLLTWRSNADSCANIVPAPFRCYPGGEKSNCSRYQSTWRVKLV